MNRYPVKRSALIPLIHLAQEQDGYVAGDAMEHIAELIGCSPAEVYGTGTFYEMFKFHPVGKYLIGVCTNISCMLNGGYELLEHAEGKLGIRTGGTTSDGMFTLEDMECIAACTEAPCMIVNYRYFHQVSDDGFDSVVEDLRAGRLSETVPEHGTLARVRQTVPADRWAASGTTAPPRPPEGGPQPALSPTASSPTASSPAASSPAASSPAASPPARAPSPKTDRPKGA
jgi:NADH-quinone oxidoreductase subunit E